MVDPQTVNKFLNQPVSGSDVGVWDVPVNANMGIVDNSFGGLATVALGAAPVTLSSAQYQCAFIRFTGAITSNVAVTFPPVGSFYTIINDTTNSSAFVVTAGTTAAGSRTIGLPPGSMTEIMTDGSNARFRGLPPVGTYVDFGGSSTPLWVSACTVQPYLNCDGTAFSSATFPTLSVLLGGTTLPDSRGRGRFNLNQGVSRITAGVSGLDGNTLGSGGGDQSLTAHVHGVIGNTGGQSATHTHPYTAASNLGVVSLGVQAPFAQQSADNTGPASNDHTHAINFNSQSAGSGGSQNMPPAYIGGITMIRSG